MAAKAAGEKLSKKEIFLSTWRRIARNWGLYLLLVPAVVLLFMFTYIPMYGIQIAFKDFTPKAGIQKDERDKPVLKNTSGRSPPASSRDFCSPQSASPAYCQSMCTLVVFSISWNIPFSLKSRRLAPFTYRNGVPVAHPQFAVAQDLFIAVHGKLAGYKPDLTVGHLSGVAEGGNDDKVSWHG